MYQVAVLDDNELSAEIVAEMVRQHKSGSQLHVSCFTRLNDLIRSMTRGHTPCDIVFMDIQLAEDEPNGIEAVRTLFGPGSETQVIYVSGCSDMHAKAYRTKHVSFLTKPVNRDDLNEALDRALSNLRAFEGESIRVRVGRSERKINPREVAYVESEDRVVMINLSNNVRGGEHANREVVRTYMQLGEIGDLLGKGFLRAHQRYLVNIDAIAELNAQGLVLTDGTQIPVSRSRSAEVKEFFLNQVRGAYRHAAAHGGHKL